MGTIYKLTCDDPELIYYGSTTQTLTYRLYGHKYDWSKRYGKCSSCILFDMGNVEIHEIEKVETKEKLLEREDYYISNFPCVNKNRTFHNSEKYKKEYYKKNYEKCINNGKNYYLENKTTILEKQKEKITCECGLIVRKQGISRHKKSKKHLNYISATPSLHK